jgi:NAD(P)-dependent dehydrogenase (short-subunit alcohol dehydrogenase family)
MLSDTTKGQVMGKLEGKVAVITGGSSGMALASAKRFVEEGAYVFIMGRRQEALDEAVKGSLAEGGRLQQLGGPLSALNLTLVEKPPL